MVAVQIGERLSLAHGNALAAYEVVGGGDALRPAQGDFDRAQVDRQLFRGGLSSSSPPSM